MRCGILIVLVLGWMDPLKLLIISLINGINNVINNVVNAINNDINGIQNVIQRKNHDI